MTMQPAGYFRIVVLDGDGIKIGEISTATSVTTDLALDAIGALTFVIPASDPDGAALDASNQFDVYDPIDGYLGRYYFKTSNLDDTYGEGMRSVECFSQLTELTREFTGFGRRYTNHDVAACVVDLVNIVNQGDYNGWVVEADDAIGITTVAYDGVSVFSAIEEQRKRFGVHYRLSGDRKLEFGVFGDDTGVRLTNPTSSLVPVSSVQSEVLYIDSLRVVEDAEPIVNVVVPLGAGEGKAQLTLEKATDLSDVTTGSNQDGSLWYGLSDQDSIDRYKTRLLPVKFNIRPVNNAGLDATIFAADALKVAAQTYLAQHKDPRIQYDVSLPVSSTRLTLGDKVRIVYRGSRNGEGYLDVNALLYIMEVHVRRSADGNRSTNVRVSDISLLRTTDEDVVVGMARDIRSIQLGVNPSPISYDAVNALDTIAANPADTTTPNDPYKVAKFTFTIDNFIVGIFAVRLHFTTLPLSNSTTYNGSENIFNLRVSSEFPSGVYLYLDDVNVSAALGGPWNNDGENAEIDENVNIASLIEENLFQEHTLEFKCTHRVGNVEHPTDGGFTSGEGSQGYVRCNVRVFGFTQAVTSD